MTQQDVADAVSCGVPAIARYEAGTRLPEREAMKALYILSRGRVRPDDFYGVPAWEAERIRVEGEAELARRAA